MYPLPRSSRHQVRAEALLRLHGDPLKARGASSPHKIVLPEYAHVTVAKRACQRQFEVVHEPYHQVI